MIVCGIGVAAREVAGDGVRNALRLLLLGFWLGEGYATRQGASASESERVLAVASKAAAR